MLNPKKESIPAQDYESYKSKFYNYQTWEDELKYEYKCLLEQGISTISIEEFESIIMMLLSTSRKCSDRNEFEKTLNDVKYYGIINGIDLNKILDIHNTIQAKEELLNKFNLYIQRIMIPSQSSEVIE